MATACDATFNGRRSGRGLQSCGRLFGMVRQGLPSTAGVTLGTMVYTSPAWPGACSVQGTAWLVLDLKFTVLTPSSSRNGLLRTCTLMQAGVRTCSRARRRWLTVPTVEPWCSAVSPGPDAPNRTRELLGKARCR